MVHRLGGVSGYAMLCITRLGCPQGYESGRQNTCAEPFEGSAQVKLCITK